MDELSKLQLKPNSILNVPFQTYDDDFSFIVNGEEYKTSHLVSDLLSSKIAKIHINEPTLNYFIINTEHKGDFSILLKLINFEQNTIPEKDILFILEVLEILGNESIEMILPEQQREITIDNIFNCIEKHQKYSKIYSKNLSEEIEFISSHFSELFETKEDDFAKIELNNLVRILSNENLQLQDEDELVRFVNKLYSKNSEYSILYSFVFFENVEPTTMKEFIETIEIEDISKPIWTKLCLRLEVKIERKENKNQNQNRYKKSNKAKANKGKLFVYDPNQEFSGIFRYLRSKSNGKIENEISVTASSHHKNSEYDDPINVTLFEEQTKSFISENKPNSWLLFDFKKNRIIPTHYTVRTRSGSNCCLPATWVIEGSNGNDQWDIIDQQNDCPYLKGIRLVHTFEIKKEESKEYQYIRFRQTGKSVYHDRPDDDHLIINSLEFYGTLIEDE